nr:MAG TPA: hypothetical protein [Caudoviricetes sp.]
MLTIRPSGNYMPSITSISNQLSCCNSLSF